MWFYLGDVGPNRWIKVVVDSNGRLVGVTLVRPRWLLENKGKVTIGLPERVSLSPHVLDEALAAA